MTSYMETVMRISLDTNEAIVSDNRDFLRGLSPEHYFEVMSPQEFCVKFGL